MAEQKKEKKVAVLTEKDFSSFVNDKKKKLILVDFFAEWCGPCQMMSGVIEKLAEKNPNVSFAKINVDENPKLSEEYEISSIPCVIFFQDGKEVDRLIGGRGPEPFQEKIDDYFKL
jgi:thioredoxin 1